MQTLVLTLTAPRVVSNTGKKSIEILIAILYFQVSIEIQLQYFLQYWYSTLFSPK